MSEPKKYGYRALGGILLGILIMICGPIALYFLVGGVTLAGLSWLIFISPDILETYRISVLGERIIDPSHVFLPLLISGLTLIAVGIILFGLFYLKLLKPFKKIYKDLFSE